MTSPWIRKYAPKTASDVVGQEKGVARIKEFITDFRRGDKPLLLHGPTGTGKTSAVHAVAKELGLEVIELNASDARNKDTINTILGAALKQRSLFFKGKVILVDEANGLSGTKDRGGVQVLLALLQNSSYPVVITANDAGSNKLKAMRKASETVEFAALEPKDVAALLGRIAEAENLDCEQEAINAIAHRSGGDARAAVNDLQTLADGGRLTMQDLEVLGDRERQEHLQNALLRVFKTTSAAVALPAFDNVDEDISQLFLWIDENLPREYSRPEDLARAYDALAEADKYFGRIRRWQYYRFYVYIYNLLTAGIATAKDAKYPGAREYKRSSRLLSIWIANRKNAKRKAIAEKLAAKTHTSAARSWEEVTLLRPIFKRDKQRAAALAAELELSKDEANWLTA